MTTPSKLTNRANRSRPIPATRLVAACFTLALTGCAQTPTTEATPSAAQQPRTQPVTTARAADREPPRSQPTVEASTPLAYVEPQTPRAATAQAEWSPDWYRPGLSKSNGSPVACADATARDLLEARRSAIDAATAVFAQHDTRSPIVDRTVTRQLDDGSYRVWVRLAAEG